MLNFDQLLSFTNETIKTLLIKVLILPTQKQTHHDSGWISVNKEIKKKYGFIDVFIVNLHYITNCY